MSDFRERAGIFASKAAEAAKGLASRTRQVGRVTRLNMDIASEKDSIRKAYEEMGRLYYENHRDAPEGLLAPACQSIDAALAAIAAMEEEIEQLRTKAEEQPAEADFQTVVEETEAQAQAGEDIPEEDDSVEVEITVEEPSDEEAPEEPVPEDDSIEVEITVEPEEPAGDEAEVTVELYPGQQETPAEGTPAEEAADGEVSEEDAADLGDVEITAQDIFGETAPAEETTEEIPEEPVPEEDDAVVVEITVEDVSEEEPAAEDAPDEEIALEEDIPAEDDLEEPPTEEVPEEDPAPEE